MWKWAALLIIPVALLFAIALSSGSDEADAIPAVEAAECLGILEVLGNLGNHPVLWPLALAGYFILFNLLQPVAVDGALGPAGAAAADIDLSGPSPVVPVNGTLFGNGSVNATGTGTYSGFQTSVQFSGQIQFDQGGFPQMMTGTYIVGGYGELPGGQPILYGLTCTFIEATPTPTPPQDEYSITVLKLNSATHGPLGDWEIELFWNDDCSGSPIDSGLTDNNGLIDFTGLVEGTYSLKEEDRAGFTPDGDLCQPAFVGDALSAAGADSLPPCPAQPNLPFPAPGCEDFDSGAQVNLDFSPIGGTIPEVVTLNGPTRIVRGPVGDGDGDGRDGVDTEIVGMSLVGTTSVGPATVMQSPTRPSDGAFEEQNNAATGTIDFPADSFFDVFVEVDLPQMNMALHNTQPIRMECIIFQIPPEFCLYQPPVDDPIELYNEQDQLVALIVHAAHIPLPPNEILIVFNNSPVPRHADWNCDGEVNILDSLALLRFIAGLSALVQHEPCTDVGDPIGVLSLAGSAGERIAGDTDCDGGIDAVDSLAILRHVVSLPVPPPPLALGCPGLGEFP